MQKPADQGSNPCRLILKMIEIIQPLLLGLSLAAPVSPVNLKIIELGANHKFFSGIMMGVGSALADLIYLLIVFLGLSKLLMHEFVAHAIWILGAVILFVIGIKNINNFMKKIKKESSDTKKGNSFFTGFMITLTNPLNMVLWIGVFGMMMGHPTKEISRLFALFKGLLIIISWLFSILLLSYITKKFFGKKVLNYFILVSGIVFIGFAIYFGFNGIVSLF